MFYVFFMVIDLYCCFAGFAIYILKSFISSVYSQLIDAYPLQKFTSQHFSVRKCGSGFEFMAGFKKIQILAPHFLGLVVKAFQNGSVVESRVSR
jgi:hypothetical protein